MYELKDILAPEIDRVCGILERNGERKLSALFRNCYPNTFETTTKRMEDGTTYIFTGDIPAMWLRDSTAQVHQILPLTAESSDAADVIEGLIRRQFQYVLYDPYANAFNETENGNGHIKDLPLQKPMIWERKYEVDSLCFVLWLCAEFRQYSGRTAFLTDGTYLRVLRTILDLWKTEQRHGEESPYLFIRPNARRQSDTLSHDGKGAPVAYTGMTWSGFRPSDDSCVYGYLIPSNLFAITVLRASAQIAQNDLGDPDLSSEMNKLADQIENGVRQYGIIDHPKYGKIYAYETDGYGNYVLMDDSNVPSLISLPYFGYCDAVDPIYQNTRRFILSEDNPYYYTGKVIRGTGSPHTPEGYVWHIGLSLQGLTSIDPQERMQVLRMLECSDADTGYMHEGVCADDPTQFTRPWFAWSNSIFSEFVLQYARELEAKA